MQSVKLFLIFMLLSVYLIATAVWFSWGLWAVLDSYSIVRPLVSVVAITVAWMVFTGCATAYLIKWYSKAERKKALLSKPWTVVLSDVDCDWYAADDVDRHVRALDVLINGEEGASPQAMLCDLVAQLQAKPAFGLDPAKGYVVVPITPSPGLLMSMAIRSDHGLGVPGYYDTALMLKGSHGITHARRVECALSDMRKLYEEVVGAGFYSAEKEAEYAAYAVPEQGMDKSIAQIDRRDV